MKKVFISLIIFICACFSSFAYDSYSTFAASLGFGSEEGTADGISAEASLGNFGLFMGAGIFPDFKSVGFHLDMDLHLANWAKNNKGGSGASSIGGSKSFSLAYQIGLGPSFKNDNDDVLIQFTPELGIAFELETGKVYSYSYTYYGFLFGFGGDLSFAFNPKRKYSFLMGTHLAYYPVYKPSLTVDREAYDIDFDSYSRFMMNIYLGVLIHNQR